MLARIDLATCSKLRSHDKESVVAYDAKTCILAAAAQGTAYWIFQGPFCAKSCRSPSPAPMIFFSSHTSRHILITPLFGLIFALYFYILPYYHQFLHFPPFLPFSFTFLTFFSFPFSYFSPNHISQYSLPPGGGGDVFFPYAPYICTP